MTRLWPGGEPIDVWGEGATPAGFVWRGARHPIAETHSRWRVHTLWWEPGQAVWREYLKVTTHSGLLCLVYHDLIGGGWLLARVYD